jgi:hypothetical protein
MTDTTPAKEPWVHPFERAGLGKAPFRCTGMEKRTYQACPDAPIQPGASCDFCGTGIMYTYMIVSSDGRNFVVGCDCVYRTNDTQLSEEIRREERAYQRRLEHEAWLKGAPERARKAAEEAARRAVVAERNKIEHALTIHACDVVLAKTDDEYFADRFHGTAKYVRESLIEGKISEMNEETAETLSKAYRLALFPTSRHYGQSGDRVRNLLVQYEGGPGFETPYGFKRLANFIIVETGEVLVWGTTSGIGIMDNGWHAFQEGDRLLLTATVKSHNEYRGVKQTFISRAKLAKVG